MSKPITPTDARDYQAWCARKVEAEQALEAFGSKLDVWPAGWPPEAREAARAVGRKFLEAGERSRKSA
jgi:hypothetical protein